jgi:hypothetical protein
MAIVDDADIQIHLPYDKLKVEAIPDDLVNVKKDVERIIRGYLAGVFNTDTLAAWTTPAATPAMIRAIGGRFGAALIYRLRYSEDSLDDPEYAQMKYNEAMGMLMKVIDGSIVLEEVTTDTASQFDSTYFFPNDTADDPKFTMDAIF